MSRCASEPSEPSGGNEDSDGHNNDDSLFFDDYEPLSDNDDSLFFDDYEPSDDDVPFDYMELCKDDDDKLYVYDNRLCDECAKLDLEQSFARAFALYEGARRQRNNRILKVYREPDGPPYLGHFYYVASLGDRLSRSTHCKLCEFFRQTTADPSEGTCKLLAICSSESYLFDPPKWSEYNLGSRPEKRPWGAVDHNVFMAVVPEVPLIPKTGVPLRWLERELPKNGSIYRLTRWTPNEKSRLARPRDLRPRADFNLLSGWLSDCREAHEDCAPKKPAGASLPGFRAINCWKTPPVVEQRPWSASYVALSYVWGPPSGDWPQTILDAVEVTKRFGEQYLWVDRLCVNQSNLQEKQFLISKMDAIYGGAKFTIVAAAGDARTGLPGVTTTPRKPQPRVELKKHSRTTGSSLEKNPASSAPDPHFDLLGIPKEESQELRDGEWMDLHRHGFRSKGKLDLSELEKDAKIMKTHDISDEHLRIFRRFADGYKKSIDEWMVLMKQMAERKGIPLQELAPQILREISSSAGLPPAAVTSASSIPPMPVTSSSKIENPLPSGKIAGITILISTLEDPRITIKNSEWATRGWTYQEGVLSNRRLVFTEKQVYWECCGMVRNEALDLLDLYNPCGTRMADYMLSGIFDGDLHRVPELQYGFKVPAVEEVSAQVLKLDSHIRAFTSRNLSYDGDSLSAFLGVAAQYSTEDGLCLLLGMPMWAGRFADSRPGVQHTFALSLSAWTHAAKQVAENAEMYVADCPRRAQFPSWTWAGWKGRADFSTTTAAGEDEDERAGWDDSVHVDFFNAMTSMDWVHGINGRLWSAEMSLHATDGSEATMLVGHVPVVGTAADLSKTWLLNIHEPLVLRHMYLMHSTIEGEWRRLMGKQVQLHLSVPVTEAELTAGHRSGELVTVLVFASRVPFIFNGMARYLILRRGANDAGTRWERIGRLAMMLEEWEMDRFKSTAGMIDSLPVKKLGRDIVLI